jgi:hypothetical protein
MMDKLKILIVIQEMELKMELKMELMMKQLQDMLINS